MKVGKTLSNGNGKLDDAKVLAELGFQVTKCPFLCLIFLMTSPICDMLFDMQIGDYLDVAIM